MFDISFGEMVLIGVVALLVVGPQKMPELARTTGKWVAKARRMATSFRADLDREFQTEELRKLLTEQQAEMQELRHIIDENRTEIEKEIESVNTAVAPSPFIGQSTNPPDLGPAQTPAQATPQPGLPQADTQSMLDTTSHGGPK